MALDDSKRFAEDVHVPFLFGALVFGVFGGFALAVTLPISAALGRIDVGWVAHAQVHGHLQTVGFGGLFVLGVGLRLAPRFGGGTLAAPQLVRPAWSLLVAGLLGRAVAQPLAYLDVFAVLLVGGGSRAGGRRDHVRGGVRPDADAGAADASAPGAPAVGRNALAHRRDGPRCVGLTSMAIERRTILEQPLDSTLVNIQLFGVLLSAILGVGMRSFPTFFGMPPTSQSLGRVIVVLLDGGLLLWVAAALLSSDRLASIGTGTVGVAVLLSVTTFGLGRFTHRLAAASSGFVWGLQPAMAWLAATGVGLVWTGLRAALRDEAPALDVMDALRHLFAVGMVTLAIATMAQLILPEFASERIVRAPAPWRGAAFGIALSIAAVLRGVVPWTGAFPDHRFSLMGIAGAIGLLAVAVFAGLYWRARRRHLAYMARIAAMRGSGA